jgi:hypothetical protein
MPQATYSPSLSVGGVSIQKSVVRTGDHPNPYEVTLPVAKALTSWVKTDANTAAGNLAGGHGYSTGKFDVYWTSGSGGRRYNVDGTVTVNALALDGGTGDDFPASADTTVVVTPQTTINTAIDGDNIQIIGIAAELADQNATSKLHITFRDVGAAAIADVDLVANYPVVYDIAAGVTNPFTGNPITVAYASNGNTTYTATLKICSLEDSTP